MKRIDVKLTKTEDRSYPIRVETGLGGKIGSFLAQKNKERKYAVIADDNVASIYGDKIINILKKTAGNAFLLTFKAGEKSKNIGTLTTLLDKLLIHGFTRHDAIIALGGGVTGDLAGFAASVYMRGISLIHMPTSLLAMVDSAIGGKTGINLKSGKNLAGTFHQPEMVLIDPDFLKTLPKKEFTNGFAEIIKYGVIADEKLFCLLENSVKKHSGATIPVLNKIITRCAEIKASITEKDERENRLRMILNYGHTSGHAIERISQYKIPHGEAISLGMVIANRIGVYLNVLKEYDALRIRKLLNAYNLPTSPAHFLSKNSTPEKLWQIILSDKKMGTSKLNFIIPEKVGHVIISDQVNRALFLKSLRDLSK
jgi:3-dehydroquinate synthase